jgi:hypothetical protein
MKSASESNYENASLRANLSEVFKQLKHHSSAMKKQMIDGIVKLNWALQKVMTRSIIADGYARIGPLPSLNPAKALKNAQYLPLKKSLTIPSIIFFFIADEWRLSLNTSVRFARRLAFS